MNARSLDRLTCKSIGFLTYGQQTYCQNFGTIGKGGQKLSSGNSAAEKKEKKKKHDKPIRCPLDEDT